MVKNYCTVIMDKNGLGPVVDDNGNIQYETTKEDKMNIFADTLLGLHQTNSSNLLHLVSGGRSSSREHVAIDMLDGWEATATSEYSRRLAHINDNSTDLRNRTTSRPRSNVEKLRLHHICVSANECVDQLEKVRSRLAQFASHEDLLAKGQKLAIYPNTDFVHLADLAYQIMSLSREAFVPAHRLCSAVIGLYMTEDYIREPTHTEFPDYFEGRIRIPSKRSNRKTLLQLQMCVDTVTELYAKFQPTLMYERNKNGGAGARDIDEMRGILLMVRHTVHELFATGSGCFDLLNILLYIEPPEQEAFTEFLNNLSSMEKSDLLEGISKLRRTVDHIPLLLEKLSWASYTVFRLASGKSPTSSPTTSGLDTPNLSVPNSKQSLNVTTKKNMEALAAHAQNRLNANTEANSNSGRSSKSPSAQNRVVKKKSDVRVVNDEAPGGHLDGRSRSRSREKLAVESGRNSSHSGDRKARETPRHH